MLCNRYGLPIVEFKMARRQGATLFELRCLLDVFDLGDGNRSELADVVHRFPGDARWPEYERAQRILCG